MFNIKRRNNNIDYLRGLSIFIMVFLHASSYYLNTNLVRVLWDYGHFAVAVFIFCSAYVFFIKKFEFNLKYILAYIKKRVFRLIVPYYIFLFFHILLLFIGKSKISFSYVVKSITLTGGIDLSWLVLLFVELIPIMILVKYLVEKRKGLFYLYTTISLVSALVFIFFKPPIDFRFIMWLPWSSVICFTWFLYFFEKKSWFYYMTSIFFLSSFILLRTMLDITNSSLVLIKNKYPPNLYLISYGLLLITILYFLAKKGAFSVFSIKKFLNFLSTNSYSIFFIHVLVIYAIRRFIGSSNFNWIGFFIVVFITTIIIQHLLNVLRKENIIKV